MSGDTLVVSIHTLRRDGYAMAMRDETIDLAKLAMETERLCLRYVNEIVLPLSLCPWAAPALQKEGVQMVVITSIFDDAEDMIQAATEVRELLARVDDHAIELVLVLLPRCTYSRLEMDDLLRAIRQDGGGRTAARSETSFALAAFHPDAPPDTTSSERFIPYLRRSPDPMIQAVRHSTLAKIDPGRGAGTAFFDAEKLNFQQLLSPAPQPLRKRIADANLATCQHAGLSHLEKRFASILEDHRQTRALLHSTRERTEGG